MSARCERRAVHVGVLLRGLDQGRDPGDRVGDLAEQQLGLHGVGEPPQRSLEQLRRAGRRAPARGSPCRCPPPTKTGASVQRVGHAVVLEPLAHLVLAASDSSSGLSSGGSAARWTASSCTSTRVSSSRWSISSCASIASLCRIAGDPVAQRGVGADGCGRRVVQLVGEPGRQGAEGEQLLALPDDLLGVAHPEEEALEQVDRHREPLADRFAEVGRRQHEHLGLGDRARGGRVGHRLRACDVALHGAGVDAALVGAGDLDLVRADPSAQRDRAVQQQHEDSSAGSPSTSTMSPAGTLATQPRAASQLELLVGQGLEEEERAQLVGGDPAVGGARAQVMRSPGSGGRASRPWRPRRRPRRPA